ncbi:hypothetical protein NXY56_003228 [Leishmania guyanensis]|uniref:Membrane-associated protein n=2 Tax=Leishmania guyanensis species complex TaxID=38579 RepID=A0AAW3BNR2_9TRYP|nr:hypothetical protein, conserved [Leishmania guyanensis]
MTPSSLLAVLVLFLVTLGFVNGDVSFNFNGMIVLKNATLNTDFVVTTSFVDLITSTLQDAAHPRAPLMTVVQSVPPHLVILLNMWYTGTPTDVQTAISNINGTYMRWANGDALNASGALSYACMTNIGQQPTVIKYTNSCSFWNAPLPPSSAETCSRNLSLLFYTADLSELDPRARLKSALCTFLSTDCDLISYGDLAVAQINLRGSLTTVHVMPFTVLSQNREATLATLVTYAQYASVLVEYNITYILADGVQVFFKGFSPQLSTLGTFEKCAAQMWYLIFLIILVPVIFMVSHRMFLRGRVSGKRSIAKSERDIRAGVHLNSMPWANFGGGGGYQYYPQQVYSGGYGGGDGSQQVGGGDATQENAPPQPFEYPFQTAAQGWEGQQYGAQQYDRQQYVI